MIRFRRARANRRRRGRRRRLRSSGACRRCRLPAAGGAAASPTRSDASDTGAGTGSTRRRAVAAQRELHDHGPARSGEPHAHGRATPHLAQHIDHSGNEPALPPLLQRVAQHAVVLDARDRAGRRLGTGGPSRAGLGLDRRHEPEARRHERRAGRRHLHPALHRARRREHGRSHGGRGPARGPGGARRNGQRPDRLVLPRPAHVLAHGSDRQLLLPRAVVSEDRRLRGHRAGTAISSTPRPSSSPISASTTSG